MYWPRPVRSLAQRAVTIEKAPRSPPAAKSAMMLLGMTGVPSGEPMLPRTPAKEM